ncbi:uncharacterized protein LOC128301783 [Anopheles moucheti]|uniref:uncharacterized protein LOC128301783 n=1 Tax=Anopheles moucheti TaxID=186751 RepID=UPI0022F1452A|nr:uncharacterized protein LOC128301783 [Anopheles moucheti]
MEETNKPSCKQQFIDAYSVLVQAISAARFDEFKEFFANESDYELAVQEFRNGFKEALLSKVNRLWDETAIDDNVALLEMLKSKASGRTAKMWRPTGKSVSEQVLPMTVNKLKTSLKFYQHQLEFQKERTEALIYTIETMRSKYRTAQTRRNHLLQQIANEKKTFDATRAQQKSLDHKVNDDLLI